MARSIMPSKAVPFSIEDWQSVVIQGLTVLNRNNWFPVMTLMIGNPGETDEDVMATLDLVYEIERRGLFAFLVLYSFTPIHDTRLGKETGRTRTDDVTFGLQTPFPGLGAAKTSTSPSSYNGTEALQGETVTYSVAVSNTGFINLTGVSVTDAIPPEVELISWQAAPTTQPMTR